MDSLNINTPTPRFVPTISLETMAKCHEPGSPFSRPYGIMEPLSGNEKYDDVNHFIINGYAYGLVSIGSDLAPYMNQYKHMSRQTRRAKNRFYQDAKIEDFDADDIAEIHKRIFDSGDDFDFPYIHTPKDPWEERIMRFLCDNLVSPLPIEVYAIVKSNPHGHFNRRYPFIIGMDYIIMFMQHYTPGTDCYDIVRTFSKQHPLVLVTPPMWEIYDEPIFMINGVEYPVKHYMANSFLKKFLFGVDFVIARDQSGKPHLTQRIYPFYSYLKQLQEVDYEAFSCTNLFSLYVDYTARYDSDHIETITEVEINKFSDAQEYLDKLEGSVVFASYKDGVPAVSMCDKVMADRAMITPHPTQSVQVTMLDPTKANFDASKFNPQIGFGAIADLIKTIRENPEEIDAIATTVEAGKAIKAAFLAWIKTLYKWACKIYEGVKDSWAIWSSTIQNAIKAICVHFKNFWAQIVEFISKLGRYFTGTEEKPDPILENLINEAKAENAREVESKMDEIAGLFPMPGDFAPQSGDDEVSCIESAVGLFGMKTMLKWLGDFEITGFDQAHTRFNKYLSTFGYLQRFKAYEYSKKSFNWLYWSITGKNFFVEYEVTDAFTTAVKTINETMDQMDGMSNPPYELQQKVAMAMLDLNKYYPMALEMAGSTDSAGIGRMYAVTKERANPWSSTFKGVSRMKTTAICLRGKSGVGKTRCQEKLISEIPMVIHKFLAVHTHGKHLPIFAMHAQNPTSLSVSCVGKKSEFDDGYMDQFFYCFNEYLTTKDPLYKHEWADHFFKCVAEEPYPLNMAFGDKGKKYFNSPFVIATGNFTNHYMEIEDPMAYLRRIEFDCTVYKNQPKGVPFDVVKHSTFVLAPECASILMSDLAPTNVYKTYCQLTGRKDHRLRYNDLLFLTAACYLDRLFVSTATNDPEGQVAVDRVIAQIIARQNKGPVELEIERVFWNEKNKDVKVSNTNNSSLNTFLGSQDHDEDLKEPSDEKVGVFMSIANGLTSIMVKLCDLASTEGPVPEPPPNPIVEFTVDNMVFDGPKKRPSKGKEPEQYRGKDKKRPKRDERRKGRQAIEIINSPPPLSNLDVSKVEPQEGAFRLCYSQDPADLQAQNMATIVGVRVAASLRYEIMPVALPDMLKVVQRNRLPIIGNFGNQAVPPLIGEWNSNPWLCFHKYDRFLSLLRIKYSKKYPQGMPDEKKSYTRSEWQYLKKELSTLYLLGTYVHSACSKHQKELINISPRDLVVRYVQPIWGMCTPRQKRSFTVCFKKEYGLFISEERGNVVSISGKQRRDYSARVAANNKRNGTVKKATRGENIVTSGSAKRVDPLAALKARQGKIVSASTQAKYDRFGAKKQTLKMNNARSRKFEAQSGKDFINYFMTDVDYVVPAYVVDYLADDSNDVKYPYFEFRAFKQWATVASEECDDNNIGEWIYHACRWFRYKFSYQHTDKNPPMLFKIMIHYLLKIYTFSEVFPVDFIRDICSGKNLHSRSKKEIRSSAFLWCVSLRTRISRDILQEIYFGTQVTKKVDEKVLEENMTYLVKYEREITGEDTDVIARRIAGKFVETSSFAQQIIAGLKLALTFAAASVFATFISLGVMSLLCWIASKVSPARAPEDFPLTTEELEDFTRLANKMAQAGYMTHVVKSQTASPTKDDKVKLKNVAAKLADKGTATLAMPHISPQGGLLDAAIGKIISNMYCVLSKHGYQIGALTYIAGQIALMNKHVYEGTDVFALVPFDQRNEVAMHTVYKRDTKVLYHDSKNDVAIVFMPSTRQHARIDKLFISEHDVENTSLAGKAGAILHYNSSTISKDIGLVTIVGYSDQAVDFGEQRKVTMNRWIQYRWPGAVPGSCGSILVKNTTKGWRIYGMHAAGAPSTHTGIATLVTNQLVRDYVLSNEPTCKVKKMNPIDLIALEDNDDLHGSYTYEFRPELIESQGGPFTVANLKGSFYSPVKTSATDTTVFVPTPFTTHSFMGGPPKIPATLDRESYVNARKKELAYSAVHDPDPMVKVILKECGEDIRNKTYDNKKNLFLNCRTLTLEEALYGFGDLEPFDKHTSKGMRMRLWNKSKKALLEKDPETYAFFSQRIAELDDARNNFIFYYQLNFDKLKDELRPPDRVAAKKTRIFKVTDFVDNVQLKRAVGDMVNRNKTWFGLTPPTCGINPYSQFWALIAQAFEDLKTLFMDIAGFESVVIMLVAYYMWPMIEDCYDTFESRLFAILEIVKCMQCIRFDLGIGFWLGRQNSSGNWITTWLNTHANIMFLCVVAAFLAIKNNECPREAIMGLLLKIYSDDNLTALRNKAWYTAVAVAAAFDKLFHIQTTGTDKGGVTEEGCSGTIWDAEFLSRGFVKRQGQVFAPLSRSSLLAQLYYVKVPKGLRGDPDFVLKQLQINLENVSRELYEYDPVEASEIEESIRNFLSENKIPCHFPRRTISGVEKRLASY